MPPSRPGDIRYFKIKRLMLYCFLCILTYSGHYVQYANVRYKLTACTGNRAYFFVHD